MLLASCFMWNSASDSSDALQSYQLNALASHNQYTDICPLLSSKHINMLIRACACATGGDEDVSAIFFVIRDKAVKKETIPKEKKVKAVKEVKKSSSSSSSIAGTKGKKAKKAKATKGGKGKAKKGSEIANANNNNNYATLGLGVGVESEFQFDQAYPISSDGITSYTPHYMNMNMGAGGGGSGTAGLQHSHSLNNSLDLMDGSLGIGPLGT